MKLTNRYLPEYVLIAAVWIVSILGFWDLYFGADADPQLHHHLHLATSLIWLSLLLIQLTLIAQGSFQSHRKIGLAVLLVGPLLVATTAALSVLSAQRGVASGEGDALIVQNVMVTLQLSLFMLLAFFFKKRRALHRSFLFGTLILFGGIALFFALLSFVPMLKIEGPETFYRFGIAAITGLVICLGAGVMMFATDPKTRWPYLLAAGFFIFNEAINQTLINFKLISPATEIVGSLNPALTFALVFAIQFGLLASALFPKARPSSATSR